MKKRAFYAALIVLSSITACSILKSDSEKDIRIFITTFQNSLTESDEEILAQFEAKQSKEAILSVISILQNKESEYINCTLAYDQAKITNDDSGIKVEIQVALKSVNLGDDQESDHEYNEGSSLTFWLQPKENSYVITKLEGEDLYKAFATIRNNMNYAVDRASAYKERQPIYDIAKALEAKFDTVIWYASYENKNYFYVVAGEWENYFTDYDAKRTKRVNNMGLVDDQGNIIIPTEYELVGTIGFDLPTIVEVKKDGKVGYFNIETKQQIVAPTHDMIIPYNKDGAFAIVKTDSTYGWLDTKYAYQAGFPSDNAKQWVDRFYFIPGNLSLKHGNQTFCEIANKENAGYGIVMPPTYLVKTGIFEEIEGGITTTSVPMNGWTEYKETHGTWIENINDQIIALVTTMKERYIEGREEFYESNHVVFMDSKHDTLAITSVSYGKGMAFKRVGDDLLEIRTADRYYYENSYADISNIPDYTYFKLGSDLTVTALKTNRRFAPSSFVKLDSTYLSGNFYLSKDDGNEETVHFLSPDAVKYIRNEILASYGYIFPDESIRSQFQYGNFNPRYEKIDDVLEQLTDVDRHNLNFLDKIIEMMEGKAVDQAV